MIRPVRPEEYERAGRLVVTAYEALPGQHLREEYARELADVAQRDIDGEVYVALDGEDEGDDAGDLIGCVTFVPDDTSPLAELLEDGESGIRMLAVAPSAQGSGVGRALLDRCVSRGRELDRAGIILHTTPWMPAAHHLYETAGFERIPERDWSPVPQVPLLAYRLRFNE